ncbi:hypothetical protein CDEST_04888 [Colletotrichum destructivum]|uniref:Uncharacterized protein n=1 Tax=Colletotrichum destructivum TaxID=34406 RepID=A0AAX4I9A3_9PEZI|nr:hypothetical protein CDEST_04888 [Colletotrichum destructivum]
MGPAPPPIFLPEVLLPPPFEISAQIGTYHLSDLLTRVTGPGTTQGNDSSRLAVPALDLYGPQLLASPHRGHITVTFSTSPHNETRYTLYCARTLESRQRGVDGIEAHNRSCFLLSAYSRLFGPPKVKVYRDSRQRRCIRFLRSTYTMHLAFRYWLPSSS